jgi:hypothetical protein
LTAVTGVARLRSVAWDIGSARITPVIEDESITSPRFLFRDLDKAGLRSLAERYPWLGGSYVDEGG